MFGEHVRTSWVCTHCRTVVRVNQFNSHKPDCPKCKRAMKNLGKSWRVPRRTDDKGWEEISRRLRMAAVVDKPTSWFFCYLGPERAPKKTVTKRKHSSKTKGS